MFEIKGRFNAAKCYASIIEEEAIGQIFNLCNYEFIKDSHIAIMPDAHAGKGCTIGTTMTITDKVVPNLVGADIGCGMYCVKLGKVEIDFEQFDKAVYKLPSGTSVWNKKQEAFDLTRLICYPFLENVNRLELSLGTLGGGNHFIEIDRSESGDYYLIIHSGSRNLGTQVAKYYQKKAIMFHEQDARFEEMKKEMIAKYKAEDRHAEIQVRLKEMEAIAQAEKQHIPKELCYLSGGLMADYLHDVDICQQFAQRNREFMAEFLLKEMNLSPISSFHTIHNYIDVKNMILRKGAIAAYENELVIIPINMRDGCVLARGKGNPQWNYSAPHGAGRILKRSEAKEVLDMEEFKAAMKGIYTTRVLQSTLDESPMAYKALANIIEDIQASVDIVEIMKPVYNFKA